MTSLATPTDALSPYLRDQYAPISDERTVTELSVVGELPPDLDGAYVRNGPNPRFDPPGRYHWFDGDGMLHAIRFRDGKASYVNRWIRTAGLQTDEAAGQGQWTGLMESPGNNPKAMPYKDTSNTDVVFHNGSLVTSWYLCGQPVLLDPLTLETRGATDFGRGKPLRVSAHTSVDPRTGEMTVFAYGPRPPYMHYGVIDAEGRLAHWIPVELPGARFPHDMAITERSSIVMDLPLFFDPEAMKQMRWVTRFHPELPARFAVIPRRGEPDSIRWFEAEACYMYHVVNAWEDGDTIVMVGCRVQDPLQEPDPADGAWARMLANLRVRARLHEWRFDLKTGQTSERPLDDANTEFPSIDLRRMGVQTRYAYNVSLAPTSRLGFDGLVKYDLERDTSERYDFGDGRWGSEAPFAPRVGSTGEGDGYLISFVTDAREGTSEVEILDAADISAGPVARVQLPRRVPCGFHATWVPGSDLWGA